MSLPIAGRLVRCPSLPCDLLIRDVAVSPVVFYVSSSLRPAQREGDYSSFFACSLFPRRVPRPRFTCAIKHMLLGVSFKVSRFHSTPKSPTPLPPPRRGMTGGSREGLAVARTQICWCSRPFYCWPPSAQLLAPPVASSRPGCAQPPC